MASAVTTTENTSHPGISCQIDAITIVGSVDNFETKLNMIGEPKTDKNPPPYSVIKRESISLRYRRIELL